MKNTFSDLRYEELVTKKDEFTKKLRELRFQKVLGHLENELELRTLRRSIGRVNTLLHEFALGIRK
ncbi:MAG: 50S ribosomal protein L29 [Spirochaetales bacterium]|nr:50S ribosomal protein L29 [Spirochaetales bacterium]